MSQQENKPYYGNREIRQPTEEQIEASRRSMEARQEQEWQAEVQKRAKERRRDYWNEPVTRRDVLYGVAGLASLSALGIATAATIGAVREVFSDHKKTNPQPRKVYP